MIWYFNINSLYYESMLNCTLDEYQIWFVVQYWDKTQRWKCKLELNLKLNAPFVVLRFVMTSL